MLEDLVLMRALRDMNMPKFVQDDVPLFHGLIDDLFPNMHIERKPFDRKDKITSYYEKEQLIVLADQQDKIV